MSSLCHRQFAVRTAAQTARRVVPIAVALIIFSLRAAAAGPSAAKSGSSATEVNQPDWLQTIVRVTVEPTPLKLNGPQDRSQLLTTGFDRDGRPFDLTHLARYESRSSAVARVLSGGVIIASRSGSTTIIGQVGRHRVEVPVTVASVERTRPVSFQHEVVPILTKSGCNSGACHGTPTGKNGFRLSLRGYDTQLDIKTLTREVDARRINRLQPERSLMLLKATAQVPHEGGRRFRLGGEDYKLLRDWIGQGAQDDRTTATKLDRLEITPDRRVLETPATSQQFRVVAQYLDGSHRDVTHLTRFAVNDELAANVLPGGRMEKLKRGEVSVSAEYINEMVTARIVFLEPVPDFVWPNPPENNWVDRHVFAKLKLLRITPSSLTGDAEFIRRVYLDTIGKLPSPDQVRQFLGDSRPDKRKRLIDELLKRPEFADWWAMKWADRLGCNNRYTGKTGAIKYHQWIRNAMAVNMREDVFVRTILTAGGPNYSNPPASFWRRLRKGGIVDKIDPLLASEEISQLFLGIRIQCARCHNHPGERWTQDDYYGLAAFFPRLKFQVGPFFNGRYDKEDTVYILHSGEVQHARTGQTSQPRFLGGSTPKIGPHVDRREVLARWLTSSENPFFAKAAVNRIWFHLLGRGIVEPVDDFRSSNPPSNSALLDALASDFIRHGFDRMHVIRTILNSRTYQLSSNTAAANQDGEKYFSHGRVRLLQAEQLLDAICTATETAEQFPGLPLGTTAVALPDGEYKHPFLGAFGRPARALACECERDQNTNLVQALHLVSGRFVHQKVHSDAGRAARLAAAKLSDRQLIEELFLATLSRFPSDQEGQLLTKQLQASGTERRKAAEDILWALINHNEFLFQH